MPTPDIEPDSNWPSYELPSFIFSTPSPCMTPADQSPVYSKKELLNEYFPRPLRRPSSVEPLYGPWPAYVCAIGSVAMRPQWWNSLRGTANAPSRYL